MAILTEEQSILKDAAKSWVTDRAPVSALRALRDAGHWAAGHDPALWRDIGAMGWAGVIIPEAQGGAEFGYKSLGLVMEEMGRSLTASPLHATLAAAGALILGGTAAQQEKYLPRIASGEIVAALAVDESAHHRPREVAMPADATAAGFELSGKKRYVPDAANADLLLVAARTAGTAGETAGITLFLVEKDAIGLNARPLHTVDGRAAADLEFDGVPVSADAVLGEVGRGWAVLDAALDRARATLAAEMLGTATAAFEITLDYLKTRTQFGQKIGSFQALQHRAAKMFTALELTRSAVEAALEAIDTGSRDTAALASLAKEQANEVLHLVSNEMVQMHGGIGMTDACDAGLYLKRARVAEALYGSSSFHRDRYARLGGF